MALSKDELQASLKILKALDETIATGPWDYNLFFKGIGKQLLEARERFVRELGLEGHKNGDKGLADEAEAAFIEVYVSLYQAEGANISKWQTVVNTLAGYNLTRPVYKNETDVVEAIRSKEFKQNDAYVAVKILKADITQPFTESPPVDRYGHELLVLREGAVRQENISRFVHMSGEYEFRNNTLVKKS